MKSHPFDTVSFVFGTVFVLFAAGFGFIANIIDLSPDVPFGYLVPIAIIGVGVWLAISATLKGAKNQPVELTTGLEPGLELEPDLDPVK